MTPARPKEDACRTYCRIAGVILVLGFPLLQSEAAFMTAGSGRRPKKWQTLLRHPRRMKRSETWTSQSSLMFPAASLKSHLTADWLEADYIIGDVWQNGTWTEPCC